MRLTTKPGAFLTVMGLLLNAGHGLHGVMGGAYAGLQAANNFHQGHHWHGVEKMHADKAVSAGRDGGQFGDGDRGCVGCHDHVGGDSTSICLRFDLQVKVLVAAQ